VNNGGKHTVDVTYLNGDQIYTWTDLPESFGSPQGGPVIYSSKDWAEPARATTVIHASVPPVPGNDRTTMLVGYGVSAGRVAPAGRRVSGQRVRPGRPGTRSNAASTCSTAR
jgi:hypothetical protein